MTETQNTRGRVCRCGRTFKLQKDAADFLLCPECRTHHHHSKAKSGKPAKVTQPKALPQYRKLGDLA